RRRTYMHAATRTALVLSLLLTAAAASAHAQSGRADLRYVAPLPSAVLFTTIDTIESTMNGLPTGSMTTRGSLQSTSELRFDTGSGDVVVTATLKEMSGQMSSPMGSMPIDASEG